jgi:Large ribosomal RNA subunit accumulation protein YceD
MKRDQHSGTGPPWSVPVAVHDVPETGLRLTLAADERTRASIAQLAQIRALPRFEASFELGRRSREGLHVVGRISANVGQTCVVTLDPVDNQVEENIDLVFAPTPASIGDGSGSVEDVVFDSPEPLINGVVDLGAIATEFLLLAIDPYPRKPGAVFHPPAPSDDSDHPFAALAVLKKGR